MWYLLKVLIGAFGKSIVFELCVGVLDGTYDSELSASPSTPSPLSVKCPSLAYCTYAEEGRPRGKLAMIPNI